MPAPTPQTDDEKARNQGGLCACGCDEPLPMVTYWPGWGGDRERSPWATAECAVRAPGLHESAELCACGCGKGRAFLRPVGRWFSRACSQRAYRARCKTGRVVNKRERLRIAELREADRLDMEAKYAQRQWEAYKAETLKKTKQAKAIRDRWAREDAGQLKLKTKTPAEPDRLAAK